METCCTLYNRKTPAPRRASRERERAGMVLASATLHRRERKSAASSWKAPSYTRLPTQEGNFVLLGALVLVSEHHAPR